tara:strand:- start:388 stop:1791 length:1404 start_codon:yes stop_codon:yes gene_type:complete
MKFKFKQIFTFVLLIFVVLLGITAKNIKDNLDTKSNQIDFLEETLKNKKSQLTNLHEKLSLKNISIEEILFDKGIFFEKIKQEKISINNNQYIFKVHQSNDIIFAKHPEASSSAYIDFSEEDIFLITATGQIVYSKFKDLKKDNFEMKSIKSNIKELIIYPEFYSDSAYGIKDILIYKNSIFISYINELKKDCYNTSVLKGNLNYNYISFKQFYISEKCISKNEKFYNNNKNDKFVAHQAGGRMKVINDNLILTVGEYRYRVLAQDTSNDFGKIISINLNSKNKQILSIGHRNPQGLFFDKNLNKIFSTEHGPNGGDEINVIDLNATNLNNNYGWPIASYGNHYFEVKNDNRFELSPLKKSHSKNNFVEPLKYFVPSVAISEIIRFSNNNFKNQYLVGTMGTAKKIKEGMLSLYYFEYSDEDNKIISSEFIPIKSRVRDLFYYKKENMIVMYLETFNSLGVINLDNN